MMKASGTNLFGNKIVRKKWEERLQRVHRDKLLSARSCTDNKLPTSLRFPILKYKKKQQEEGRQHEG